MPHKRAKRAARTQENDKEDLPPTHYSDNDMPKSMARVLNAETTQKLWKERQNRENEGPPGGGVTKKKRKVEQNAGSSSSTSKVQMKIQPGESLRHFKRRVEDDMRPVIRAAMKNTSSESKEMASKSEQLSQKGKKTKAPETNSETEAPTKRRKLDSKREPSPDFARFSSSDPKRLNDIVKAPPSFKAMPRLSRLASNAAHSSSLQQQSGGDVDDTTEAVDKALSAARKRMMELEREKAIARYRSLKEVKLKHAQKMAEHG